MKVKLSEQSKAEFIEHISKQSIECWFDGDVFIMPSGQGKASKGIVLHQLEVWQSKQAEIDEYKLVSESMEDAYLREKAKVDELQKRIDRVAHILTYTNHASTPLCNELRDILKGNSHES